MAFHPHTPSQATMVKWRDLDAGTIAKWIEQPRIREITVADGLRAPCDDTRPGRRFGTTTWRQIERDLEYTYNCA